MNIRERLLKGTPLIMDGAMGTLIQEKLGGYRGCYELLNVDRPDIIVEIHRSYVDAGADIIETNSFGGNILKLAEYGLGNRCVELNERAAMVARRAAGDRALVAGSIAPTGALVEPLGDTPVEEVYEAYKAQIKGLLNGGVDLLAIETMHDIQEARLALLAARELTDIPVICSMTFETSGRTMTGTDPLTAFATLAACGADAVGANCSMGPDGLLTLFRDRWDAISSLGIPLSVWSNAGLPRFVDGKNVYSLGPEEFAHISAGFAGLGFRVIGGCCGTTPSHIRALKERVNRTACPDMNFTAYRHRHVTSRSSAVAVDIPGGFLRIGERLNPTARKKFAEELKAGSGTFLREEARAQAAEGAHVLDINVGVPSIDEVAAMRSSVRALASIVAAPLMIDSDNSHVLETALMVYPGIAIVNSVSGKTKSMETIIPVVKRFGSFVVALCMDETGIHQQAEKRITIGEKIIGRLVQEGISTDRIFVDALMLAESAEPGSAMETLKVIRHFSERGIKTSLGLSNISFGLPARKHVNNAYLWMAVREGLSAAIVNPSALTDAEPAGVEADLARAFLTGHDPSAASYIAHMAGREEWPAASAARKAPDDPVEAVYALVVEGNTDTIEVAVNTALSGHGPDDVMNRGLLRGLEKVGELYSTGEYFLPQMIASAAAMKKGFAILKPLLSTSAGQQLGTVVIGTVRGDVHDIGKNIVAMMLENHGFQVHDLGKDVPSETFIEKARQLDADLICMSSLLTTTMGEMKTVSSMARDAGLRARLLVGGAVVTADYAESIAASYGRDAVEAVARARELVRI